MPPDVREWLPEGHLAWFVIDAVGEMDLDAFYAAYRVDGRSRPAYDPAMMVALLLYAYARGIAVLAGDRAGVRRGRRVPGDRGAAAARSRDDRAVRRAPPGRARRPVRRGADAVRAQRAGEGRGDRGRRHEGAGQRAAATRTSTTSRSRARSSRRPSATDAAEDELYGEARGDELPPEFATAQGRRGWLREAKQRLEAERAADPQPVPRSRAKRAQGGQAPPGGGAVDARCAPTQAYEAYRARGRMKDGRRFGRPPEPYTPPATPEGRINITDPDSRVVKGAARVHPGLQRAGRHQRAPDRARRRGR